MRIILCTIAALFFHQSFSQSAFTSGGKIKPEQAIMDIRHYKIALDLNIPQRTINGYTTIDFNLSQPTKTLLFDLLDSFSIKEVMVNGKKASYNYANNMITINLAQELQPGKVSVTVSYGGKPHIAIRP